MKKLLLIIVTSMLLAACGSQKNIAYLQNCDSVDLSMSQYLYDAKIMPKDVITITVNTVDPKAAETFNLTTQVAKNLSENVATQRTLLPYLVDNNGCIDFPVLGQLQVGGLTKSECEKMIHDKIMPYLSAAENPVVSVRLTNYKISVLGEVNRPGMFTVSNEKINIFEALAQAGDMTIYGVRNRVKLIREDAQGKKDIYTLNLNDANLINSPYYYLQQNDIVYVEPNKAKAQNSTIGSMTTLWLSATGILVSVASLLVNILR